MIKRRTEALFLLLSAALLCGGCFGDSDQADSLTGPGVEVHCDALRRAQNPGLGDTTVKVVCPNATP